MKVVILGGGIAGLYAAFELLKRHKTAHITILEKANYWGGRIKTVRHDGATLDVGAGRFNDNHRLLLKLLHELGFNPQSDFYPLSIKRDYVKDNKLMPHFNTTQHIKDLIAIGKTVSPLHLKSITLKFFMREHLPDTLVDDIIYSFGYNTEFDLMNAYDALQIFETDFLDTIQYYTIIGGLEKLIKALVKKLQDSGRVSLHLQTNVLQVKPGLVTTQDGRLWKCDKIISCLTKKAMENIYGFENNKQLQATLASLGQGELLRVFARFPSASGDVWFKDIPRTTTNNMLRYVIPINPPHGTIMASYTDGSYAREWNSITDIKPSLLANLRKMFPAKSIPDPLWVKSFYWPEGTHCWLPGAKKYKNTRDKSERYGYFVCGEMVSTDNQAWIEGALDSVHRVLHLVY